MLSSAKLLHAKGGGPGYICADVVINTIIMNNVHARWCKYVTMYRLEVRGTKVEDRARAACMSAKTRDCRSNLPVSISTYARTHVHACMHVCIQICMHTDMHA